MSLLFQKGTDLQAKTITYSKKVCMLGAFGVGKTSLVRRFVHDVFDDQYLSTIGVQIYEKQLAPAASHNEELKLIFWDLANIEKLTPVIRNYFKGAAAAIVVVDLTRPATFDQRNLYIEAFMETNPNARLVLAGNKADLLDDPRSATSRLQEWSTEKSAPHFLTSAKTGDNVPAMFEALAGSLLSDD